MQYGVAFRSWPYRGGQANCLCSGILFKSLRVAYCWHMYNLKFKIDKGHIFIDINF